MSHTHTSLDKTGALHWIIVLLPVRDHYSRHRDELQLADIAFEYAQYPPCNLFMQSYRRLRPSGLRQGDSDYMLSWADTDFTDCHRYDYCRHG
jgi:hypothetical protein